MNDFIIIKDVQEKPGFHFEKNFLKITSTPQIIVKHLSTGDYSLEGFENKITIERKSLTDLFGSCGGKKGVRRDRLEREFIRMSEFEYAALVIEADWQTIYTQPPNRSKVNPKNILRTLMAWHMRYNVHIWACPGRKFAEKITYLLLDRFYRDQIKAAYDNTDSIADLFSPITAGRTARSGIITASAGQKK